MKLVILSMTLLMSGTEQVELNGFGFKIVATVPGSAYKYSTSSFVEGMAYNFIFVNDSSAISFECVSNRPKRSKTINLIETDTLFIETNRVVRSFGLEETSSRYWQQDMYLDIDLVINCWNVPKDSLARYFELLSEVQIVQ